MKTSLLKYILAPMLALLLASCAKDVEKFEKSPNEPDHVSTKSLLPAAQVNLFMSYNGGLARDAAMFTQQQAGTGTGFDDIDVYNMDEVNVDREWTQLYAGTMMDAQRLTELAEAEQKPYYAGIGRVIKAMALGVATDAWGDVPATEALQGDKFINPRYDNQEQVYAEIQKLLDAAVSDFSLDPDSIPNVKDNIPASDDLMFGGDMNNWLITAYTLKARYYNHLSKKDAAGSAQSALDAVQLALDAGASNASDAQAHFGKAANESNLWSLLRSGDMVMGAYLVDTMNAEGDPRLALYATPDNYDEYSGYPAGGGPDAPYPFDNEISSISYRRNPDASLPMVTYRELKFIEAECHLRLGNTADAAAAYNDALATALDMPNIGPTQDYLDAWTRDETSLTQDDLMYQKYLALFAQIEVWTDYRRTGFPDLPPAYDLTLDDYPRSMPTPQSESIRNTNSPKRSGVTARVWWDM